MCELINTVKFTFSNGSEKPNIGEVVAFVKALNADHGQIEAAYRMAEEKSLFVKFKTEKSMVHALTFNSDDLIFHYGNGKKAKVHMSHAQEYIFYVRIYDLPPEVPDHELALVLGKYGKVKRVVREKIPVELGLDAYTGVRGVYMDVKKEIPTSLHFLNRKGNIFYSGNKDKCFLCKADGHRMNSCPKRKVRNHPENHRQEEEQNCRNTYAGAVTGGAVTVGAVIGGAVAGGAVTGGEVTVDAVTVDAVTVDAVAVDTVTGGAQSDNNHHEIIEEEMSEAAKIPTAADISEAETSEDENHNHPMYQLAVHMTRGIKKKMEEEKRKKAKEEEAKIKSPPRKKKNFSLYKK